MPIWNSQQDEIDFSIILEALENLDLSGVTGFPKFTHTRAGTVSLDGDRAQIVPTQTDVAREVFIRNTSGNPLELYLGTQTIRMATLGDGNHFWDTFNSGLPIEAVGTGTIEIVVRQDQEINYALGADMVFPIGVTLRVGTGANFAFITQTIQDAVSDTFNQNIRKFFDSDEGVDGHKIAVIDTFTPGRPVSFTVTPTGTSYDNTQAIQFQWLNQFALLRLGMAVASDVINPAEVDLSSDVGGIITDSMHAGEVAGAGGVLTIQPSFLNIMGRFVAVKKSTGYYDTAIIKDYTPNPDPLLGGTFTLEGF